MTNKEEYHDFGKLKKTKYKLIIGGEVLYSFVTTIRDEKSCVELMKERAGMMAVKHTRAFSITKTIDNNTEMLFRGSVKGV